MTLALDLARSIDPVELASAIDLEPQDWQQQVLRTDSRRVILACARQTGKTVTMSLLALHAAVYEPGALVLVVSASERQARELFRTAVAAYRSLGRPVESEVENRLSLELENGSRIIVVPASPGTIRGYSRVSLLLLDEAAQIEDEVFQTVYPMLSVSQGRLVAASTPHGRRGWFWERWSSDDASWLRIKVTAWDAPHIPRSEIEEARRTLGEFVFSQEYEVAFVEPETAAFLVDDVERMFDQEVEPWSL